MIPPRKPFPEYKWQWATLTCTEGLNDPAVFLGVLRAMAQFEEHPPSDPAFKEALTLIEKQTKTKVKLARDASRNLLRNSGQYWKALDLIEDAHGKIKLTPFGRKVADGSITPIEFAATTIKTLELPNRRIEQYPERWEQAHLKIKPLELILNILAELSQRGGPETAYLTRDELVRIIIPLAGESANIDKNVDAIILYRRSRLDLSDWPNCAPMANDQRIAREFLLFLSNYGFLQQTKVGSQEQFVLNALEPQEIRNLINLPVTHPNSMDAIELVKESQLTFSVEQKKVMMELKLRPMQPKFRKEVMQAYGNKCIVTGTELPAVLQAAHIIPAKHNGINDKGNGFCLRADIHLLFDTGHLRIDDQGNLHLSDSAAKAENYRGLPRRIIIPSFVNLEHIRWRWSYT